MSFPTLEATIVRRADQPFADGDPKARTSYVARSAQTNNDFGIFEYRLEPGGGGPKPHYHPGFSESFYVLEGQLAVLSGHTWTTAGEGDLVYVPRHGVHAFHAVSADVGARFLILFTPGIPREEYFSGLVELRRGDRSPTTEEVDAFAALHGQINLHDWPTDRDPRS